MAKFALLLHHAPDRYTNLNEDDLMSAMKDYIAWVEKTSDDGNYAGGHKLSCTVGAEVTSGANGIDVHDSPFAELAEVLGGLMIVEAVDIDAAIELARNHPHLVHNSRIEVRQIEGEE